MNEDAITPRGYMRRWAFEGIEPRKERNPETGRLRWPTKFLFHAVTGGKCQHDDEALIALADVRELLDAARAVAADQTRDPEPGTPLAALDAALTRWENV